VDGLVQASFAPDRPNNMVSAFREWRPVSPAFCHMIEEQTAVRAKELRAADAITYGALHLGTGGDYAGQVPSRDSRNRNGKRFWDRAWEDKIGDCLTELQDRRALAQCFLPFRCPRASPRDGAGAFAKRCARDNAAARDGNLCGPGRKRASGGAIPAEAITWTAPENLMEVW